MALKDPFQSVTFGNSLLLRVDGAVGAMSLSPNGRDAVLAGRRGLFIIDLDEPFTTPRWLHHITSWEVADVQWSPHKTKPSWCISTSNQKALLWDLSRPSDSAIVNVLHEHTRAITDINFHPSDPELLATCSIDTFVLSWDMRTPRKAVQQWAEWRAGATQVKWNHKNPFEIASSHDHSFYIWDTRKGALPMLKIEDAHEGKINGVNFTDGLSNIITSSNDQKIKFWDLTTPHAREVKQNFNVFEENRSWGSIDPSLVVLTDFPVARARTLPFGNEKACGVMPLRGGQDAVHILNCDAALKNYQETQETQYLDFDPIYSYKGHGGPMKDFLWRTRHELYEGFDTRRSWKDYQLVTWSSLDYDLKLWPHDDRLYAQVNYDPMYLKAFDALPGSRKLGAESPEASSRTNSLVKLADGKTHNYNSYCVEPPITLSNILQKNKGDLLSSMTMFQIAKKHKNLPTLPSQLNHLAWISGVRMGRTSDQQEQMNTDDSTPSNLGEEVTMVAHTFPKVRFEKISVSTGELILSLRGPIPQLEYKPAVSNGPGVADTTEPDDNKTNDVSVLTEDNADTSTTQLSSTGNDTTGEAKDTEEETRLDQDQDSEQKLIFIRLEITFPKNYPFLDDVPLSQTISKKAQKSFVQFGIEESYELTHDIKDEMLKNLREIAHFFSNKHQRFCLEPLLRYLMGDKINLDDSLVVERPLSDDKNDLIQEIGKEGWADDLVNQQPSDSISTDDDDDVFDDELSDFMPALNDEEMVNSTGSLGKADSNDPAALALRTDMTVHDEVNAGNKFVDSTPIPKGCGAIWTPTGQLVCFFIPKENENEDSKVLQKFSIFRFTDAGFSLDGDGRSSDEGSSNQLGNESDESNDSDASSSSSDSFANDWDDMDHDDLTSRFRVPGLFKTSVGLGNRYISRAGKSNNLNRNTSQGGTGSNYKSSVPGADLEALSSRKKKSKSGKNKNIVGIFDFSHLLPDKKELAKEYRVLGDTPERLANYNSQVASKYGLTEISDAWRLLEMVLIKDIEVNDMNPIYHSSAVSKDPNSTVAKNVQAMNHLMKVNEMTQKLFRNKTYRFYWGSHPYGYVWLIEEMMKYFEKKGNLQMLVMISCILYENTKNVASSNLVDALSIPIHTPYEIKPQPPSSIQVKRFNESSHGEVERNHSSYESVVTDGSDMKLDNGFSYSNRHLSSSLLVFRKETVPRYAGSIGSDDLDDSPERTILNSLARRTFSMSPLIDNDRQRKEYRRPRGINNSHNRKMIKRGTVRPPPVVQVTYQNVDSLDLFDDVYTRSLLSSQEEEKIKAYREQYAEMLFLWGLPANRIKILKFNYPNATPDDGNSRFNEHHCSFGFRKQTQAVKGPTVHEGSTVNSSYKNAWVGNKSNKLKYCSMCNLLVSKRLVICTNCEHVLHSNCALEWWKDNEEEDCPSGCGCKCLNYRI